MRFADDIEHVVDKLTHHPAAGVGDGSVTRRGPDSTTLGPTYPPIPWAGRAATRYPAACNSGIRIPTAATVSVLV